MGQKNNAHAPKNICNPVIWGETFLDPPVNNPQSSRAAPTGGSVIPHVISFGGCQQCMKA